MGNQGSKRKPSVGKYSFSITKPASKQRLRDSKDRELKLSQGSMSQLQYLDQSNDSPLNDSVVYKDVTVKPSLGTTGYKKEITRK